MPSLITTVSGEVRDLRSSIAFSARYSCKKPRVPARKIVKMITAASISSPSKTEMIEAVIKMIISTLLNCEIKSRRTEAFSSSLSSFSPYSSSLFLASSELKPASDIPNSSKTELISWS